MKRAKFIILFFALFLLGNTVSTVTVASGVYVIPGKRMFNGSFFSAIVCESSGSLLV